MTMTDILPPEFEKLRKLAEKAGRKRIMVAGSSFANLLAAYQALAERAGKAEADLTSMSFAHTLAEERAERAEAELDALRKALIIARGYARHDNDCRAIDGGLCGCGYLEAHRRINEALAAPPSGEEAARKEPE